MWCDGSNPWRFKAHPSSGVERTIIGAVGDNRDKGASKYAESLPGVEKTMPILKPYKLASRESHEGDTVINVGFLEMAGRNYRNGRAMCLIESEEQLLESAYIVKKGGRADFFEEAAPSNRARHPTVSRVWKRKASRSWMPSAKTGCRQ